ncbi:MAG: class I SAM-dependent methyltransferase [Acidimicrobiia bacterium]
MNPDPAPSSVDDLVAELAERVAERRRAGAYPPGLEEDLTSQFRRALDRTVAHDRGADRAVPDLGAPLEALRRAGRFDAGSIPTESRSAAGALVHGGVARLVRRQVDGTLRQMARFAAPLQSALEALAGATEALAGQVGRLGERVDFVEDRLAACERVLCDPRRLHDPEGTRPAEVDAGLAAVRFHPWYDPNRFDDEFRGSQAATKERYRDVAGRLAGAGAGPVLDIGCGRGEFLDLLGEAGVEARGVEIDLELAKQATARGLDVAHGDGLAALAALADGALGGLVLIQVVEHLSAQELVDLVALAARKVRPGGMVLAETVNPCSLYVFTRALYLDPTHLRPVHPGYLSFLFREAGFGRVEIDWRAPVPAGEQLETVDGGGAVADAFNANVSRLNQILFGAQDYLLVATR